MPWTPQTPLTPTADVVVGTNSYVTVEEADAYSVTTFQAAVWAAATPDEQAVALIVATSGLERLMYRGVKYLDTQTLAFPRSLFAAGRTTGRFSEEDERYSSVRNVSGWTGDGTVPQAVKNAQVEEAIALLATDTSVAERAALRAQGVTSVRIGDFAETYAGASRISGALTLRSPIAIDLLREYLIGTAAVK